MAQQKTAVSGEKRTYTTRNFPTRLYDALRLEAVRRRITLEDAFNQTIELGLKVRAEIAKNKRRDSR